MHAGPLNLTRALLSVFFPKGASLMSFGPCALSARSLKVYGKSHGGAGNNEAGGKPAGRNVNSFMVPDERNLERAYLSAKNYQIIIRTSDSLSYVVSAAPRRLGAASSSLWSELFDSKDVAPESRAPCK
jgi:hypothetical protein